MFEKGVSLKSAELFKEFTRLFDRIMKDKDALDMVMYFLKLTKQKIEKMEKL